MKETETLKFFVKAMYSLKDREVVLDSSIPKGFFELHLNPDDEVAINKMNFKFSDKVMRKAMTIMIDDIHTHFYGKEATDRLSGEIQAKSKIRSWFRSF